MANIISVIARNMIPGPKRDTGNGLNIFILKLDGDPTVSGCKAPLGTIAVYEDGSSATTYSKTGTGNLDWEVITVGTDNRASLDLVSGTNTGDSVFVWRPGGVASGNVYTDFSELMTVANQVAGPLTILFDGTLGTIDIPAGSYGNSFAHHTWIGIDQDTLGFLDGAVATALPKKVYGLRLRNRGTTPSFQIAVNDLSNDAEFRHSQLRGNFTGSVPLIETAQSLFLFLYDASTTTNAISITTDFTSLGIKAYEGSSIQDDSLVGVAAAEANISVDSSSSCTYTQTNFLGTLNISRMGVGDIAPIDTNGSSAPVTAGPYSSSPGERVIFNPTGGTFTVNAPTAGVVVGTKFGVKNASTSVTTITVSANPENIESPGSYALSTSVTVGGDGVSVTWEWDGAAWLII